MKLYWRIKKNGKWTWRPVLVRDKEDILVEQQLRWCLIREEEE